MSTYTFIACRDEATIEVHALDEEKHTLRRLTVVEGVEGVNTLAFDHRRAILYAGRTGDHPQVSIFTVVAGGRLEHRADLDLPHPPAYLAFDCDGLLVASYHDSALSRIPLDAKGMPAPDEPVFTDLDAGKNIHCVAATKDGRHVYATALGSDLILIYRRGGEGEPPLVRLDPVHVTPDGEGPRHLVISPDGERVAVVTEMGGHLIAYRRDPESGALTETGRVYIADPEDHLERGVARVPGGEPVPERPMWGADLRQAREGTLWLTTERTTSRLSVFWAGDVPKPVVRVQTEEQPRAAAVGPEGHVVLVAGEKSDHVSAYDVNEMGVLTPTQRFATGGRPSWFAFQRVD